MTKWNIVTWSEVLTIKNGKNQKKVQNPIGIYPIYGSGGVMGYADDYLCDEGTTVIGRKGSINNPIFVKEKFWNVDTAFGLCPGEHLNKKFLFYFCITYDFLKHNRATTLPSLTKVDLLKIKMPLPTLSEQNKVVEILDAADKLKEKDRELVSHYEKLSQSLFLNMFGDPANNEKNGMLQTLGDYIDYIGDIGSNGSNASVSKNLKMQDTEDFAIMIRTVNLNANDFRKNIKYVSENTYNFFAKSKIYGGEIIMNKIGSAGKFWMMPKLNRPVSLGLNQLVIRVKNLDINYLYYYLSTDYLKYKIQASTRGAVTKSITKSAVKALPLLCPSLDSQKEFSNLIKEINIQKSQAQQNLKKSEDLFNSLLQQTFHTELTAD